MSDHNVDPSLFARFVPLDALRPQTHAELARKSTILNLRAGEVLFKPGDGAERALFLVAGTLRLCDADGHVVATLAAGAPSAAHRIAHQSPRRVTATCVTDVRCLAVDASLLDVMLTWDQTGSFEVGEVGVTADATGDDWMTRLLQMRTFQLVPPCNLQAMFMRMQQIEVEPGEVIVRQDDEGDFFYVVMSGRYIVTREQPHQKPVRLAELDAGACFGEEALIADSRRNATVTALTRGKLMRLDKADFRKLLTDPLSRRIDQARAQALVAEGKARWLDVRLPSEFRRGSLPGAINLPLYMLRMKLAQLDATSTWIACCDTGRRSAVAAFILMQKGFDAYVLEGGVPASERGDAP
ncbi:cyclic nucleotide-binding domain-containing protein [Sinimarinibacterium thermocellulolyticum]|uniref:Cyclic nucleotide-binding domain-containing protein n=1 Tax=Sinimarinibacterium thermocellulolyticum TaxID=3170016 RepID=A0ABV2AE12_9GAMM